MSRQRISAKQIAQRIEDRQARENVEIGRWMNAVLLVSEGMAGGDAVIKAGLIFDDCSTPRRSGRRSKTDDVTKR
jgi:hypothetical protein